MRQGRPVQLFKSGRRPWIAIEAALKAGSKLHAFRSGGGLRVVRIDPIDIAANETPTGYGEAPHWNRALSLLAIDLTDGPREYKDTYGRRTPHYWTGSSSSNSHLDTELLKGNKLDAWWDPSKGVFVGEVHGYADHRDLAESKAAVAAAYRGETARWSHRGYEYETSPARSPNGEVGASTKLLSPKAKDGADPWMWKVVRRASATKASKAFQLALKAEATEK